MTDHFDALGVPRDATDDEIKRAYRKRAAETHPDREGGSTEKFLPVQVAYETLSDKARRARYEAGDDTAPRDERAQILTEVAGLVMTAIEQLDTDKEDIIAASAKACQLSIEAIREEMHKERYRIKKREKVLARLSRVAGDGDDIVALMIKRDIGKRERQLVRAEEAIARNQMVIAVLKEYRYQTDVKSAYEGALRRLEGDVKILTSGAPG